jgi:hypothetical protein
VESRRPRPNKESMAAMRSQVRFPANFALNLAASRSSRIALLAVVLLPCLVASGAEPADMRWGDLKARRILFLGNSITLHGPLPEIGWTNNWGMAASRQETDYVHVLLSAITRLAGDKPDAVIANIADFERNYETYDVAAGLKKYLDFKPDIVVVAIGENVPALTEPQSKAKFKESLGRLLKALRTGNQPAIFVRGCFWPDKTKDDILQQSCKEAGAVFVEISALGKEDANHARSERRFAHAGVADHPGDKGMMAIADALLRAMVHAGRTKESSDRR